MIAQSSPRRFSIGVPVSASVRFRGTRRKRAVALRPGVLHVLRLVEEQAVPRDRREQVGVARRDVVRT